MIKRNRYTAELVGLGFGDGGLTCGDKPNIMRFQLRGNLTEDKEHYDNYIIPLFNKEIMIPLFGRNVGIVFNKNKGFYGISVGSIKIEKYLNYLGIPSGIKGELFIPKWIKNNRIYTISFLRGLLDTDGSIYCDKNHSIKNPVYHTKIKLSICNTSKNLIYEVNKLLNKLKIKNFIKYQKSKNKLWKDSYYIMVDAGINVKRWFDIIGSKNPKHITKFDIWKKFGFCPPRTTLEQRKKILKNRLNPYSLYTRGCRSGQTS